MVASIFREGHQPRRNVGTEESVCRRFALTNTDGRRTGEPALNRMKKVVSGTDPRIPPFTPKLKNQRRALAQRVGHRAPGRPARCSECKSRTVKVSEPHRPRVMRGQPRGGTRSIDRGKHGPGS